MPEKLKKVLSIVMLSLMGIFNILLLPFTISFFKEQITNGFSYTSMELLVLFPLILFSISIIPVISNIVTIILCKGVKINKVNLIVTSVYIFQLVAFFGTLFFIAG